MDIIQAIPMCKWVYEMTSPEWFYNILAIKLLTKMLWASFPMAHDGGHYNENGPKPICSKALVFYDQHNHLYQKIASVFCYNSKDEKWTCAKANG